MATTKRHRRNDRWYYTVLARIIDYAIVNTRAIMISFDKAESMKDLKRSIAYGLSAMAIRPELVKVQRPNVLSSGHEVPIEGKLLNISWQNPLRQQQHQ